MPSSVIDLKPTQDILCSFLDSQKNFARFPRAHLYLDQASRKGHGGLPAEFDVTKMPS